MRTNYTIEIKKINRVNVQIIVKSEGKTPFETTMLRSALPENAEVGSVIEMTGEIVWERSRYGSKAHFEPVTEEQIQAERAAEEERKRANYARKAAQVLDELRAYARDGFFADQKAAYIRKLVGTRYDSEIAEARENAAAAKARKDAEREAARRADEAKYTRLALPAYDGFRGRPQRGDKLLHDGHAYEVVSSYYNDADGWSFGAMNEEWYSVKAICIDDRYDGQKMIEKAEAEREAARREKAAREEWDSLIADIRKNGQIYDGDEISIDDIPGEDLANTMNIYGGGYILRDAGDTIWLIVNNGADGDNWSLNNIRTGGAGAYAFRIPCAPRS